MRCATVVRPATSQMLKLGSCRYKGTFIMVIGYRCRVKEGEEEQRSSIYIQNASLSSSQNTAPLGSSLGLSLSSSWLGPTTWMRTPPSPSRASPAAATSRMSAPCSSAASASSTRPHVSMTVRCQQTVPCTLYPSLQ